MEKLGHLHRLCYNDAVIMQKVSVPHIVKIISFSKRIVGIGNTCKTL